MSKDELVLANLRLAPYCVRRFLGRYRVPAGLGLDVDDLVSEAQFALCRAAESWQASRGAFTTYAGTAIHNRLLTVCRLHRGAGQDRVELISLCTPVGESGEDCLLDVLPDPGVELDEEVYRSHVTEVVRQAVSELPERDRAVIQSLLAGRSSADLAREHGCSRQRIDQIQSRAIRRLRHRLGGWMERSQSPALRGPAFPGPRTGSRRLPAPEHAAALRPTGAARPAALPRRDADHRAALSAGAAR
jgi:RNA polymerase sigma factor (sigma-70 family)